jgi:hypothetical protein
MRGLPTSTGRSRRARTSGVETSEGLLTYARLRDESANCRRANDPAAHTVRACAAALLIDLAGDDTPADVEARRVELRGRRESGDLYAIDIVYRAQTVLLDGVDDVTALATRLPG